MAPGKLNYRPHHELMDAQEFPYSILSEAVLTMEIHCSALLWGALSGDNPAATMAMAVTILALLFSPLRSAAGLWCGPVPQGQDLSDSGWRVPHGPG